MQLFSSWPEHVFNPEAFRLLGLFRLPAGVFDQLNEVYCEMLAGFVTCEGRLDRRAHNQLDRRHVRFVNFKGLLDNVGHVMGFGQVWSKWLQDMTLICACEGELMNYVSCWFGDQGLRRSLHEGVIYIYRLTVLVLGTLLLVWCAIWR